MKLFTALLAMILFAVVTVTSAPQPLAAQKKGSAKSIDVRANRAVESFSRDAVQLAHDYEQAGRYEKAKQMLQAVLSVRPEATNIKKKLKELDEMILGANEMQFDINPVPEWGKAVARGYKGKKFRIRTSGQYRLSAALVVGSDGVPEAEPLKSGMVSNIPLGAVVALFVPNDKKLAARAKPFRVGLEKEFTPEQDGFLFLKVNVPTGSKCTGRLSVSLSGYVSK